MLAIQEYIKKFGLERAINSFSLKMKEYDNKILLKYDQLVSPTIMGLTEVQECRGLILEKETYKVLSLGFKKFFNSAESNAVKLDTKSTIVLEKLDGTFINCYHDWNDNVWYGATTGTANGEGEVNNSEGNSFNTLFWKTISKYNLNKDNLNKDYVYMFELTTPYNIVVKPHSVSEVTLLAVRDRVTMLEKSFADVTEIAKELGLPIVKKFDLDFKDFGGLIRTFANMPWTEEGYVCVDKNMNRCKVKNPAYLQVHHLKGKLGNHHIMGIVKTNEIEEFISTFPERKEEIFHLKEKYDNLVDTLEKIWGELKEFKPKNITKSEQKNYATKVFEITTKYDLKQFSGMYFNLGDGRLTNIQDFLLGYDNKILYTMFK